MTTNPKSKGQVTQITLQIDRRLLEILVCPITHAALTYDSQKQELVSATGKLAYPIRDGIPIMLPHDARQINGHD